MSYVTEVAVITALRDDEAIAFVNERMRESTRGQELTRLDDAGFGGANCTGMQVYGAGYDYLDETTLKDAMEQAPWRSRRSVLVWILNEACIEAEVWSPAHGQLVRAEPAI
jgi:hypothetical protein